MGMKANGTANGNYDIMSGRGVKANNEPVWVIVWGGKLAVRLEHAALSMFVFLCSFP